MLLTLAAASAVLLGGSAELASATTTVTYTQQQAQPIPPAQHYAGSTGGDGYVVALYNGRVYNVFHHQTNLIIDCHVQSDASPCWSAGPETITDTTGNTFHTPGEAGVYLDQSTGKLWVYATRASDHTAGVVCVDTTTADTNRNPFCGFVALSAPGDAPFGASDQRSLLSMPVLVGSRLYNFNYAPGAGASGTENTVLCFDVSTDSACAGQPYSTALGSGTVASMNSPADAAIGTDLIIPISVGGVSELACFDATTLGVCTGSWPVATPTAAVGSYGAPYPLLDVSGHPIGFCLPTGADPCFNLNGMPTVTPVGMSAAISRNSLTNTAYALGPRVYVANGPANAVDCWDYSTSAMCPGFPIAMQNVTGLYTVNPDPQRPTCLWVNSDHGIWQMQNFDAYTGGPCTQTRVLATQFVVSGPPQCVPTAYTSLQVLSPTPDQYQGGSISFADAGGNPIPGLASVTLDANGVADLSGVSSLLNTPSGLPQFLISLTNAPVNSAPLNVKLTWVGPYDPVCAKNGQTVQASTALDAVLSDGTNTSHNLTEWVGTPVDNNTSGLLTGANAANAIGTVTYHWWTDSSCTSPAASDDAETITTAGTLPPSQPVNLPAGVYYETVDYSGDTLNAASSTTCGSEILTVKKIPTYITYNGDTSVYAGDRANISFVLHDERNDAVIPNESVHITLPAGLGGGTYDGTTDPNGQFVVPITAPLVNTDPTFTPSEAFAGDGTYIGSNGPGTLEVKPIPTDVSYIGDAVAYSGQQATIAFVLNSQRTGNPVGNEPVTVNMPGVGTFTGTTDGSGVFSTTITTPIVSTNTTYTATEVFAGKDQYLASSGPGSLLAKPIPTTITYTGETSVTAGSPATVSFVLSDSITNNILPNMPVTITLPGGGTASGTTDSNGVFSTTTAALAAGTYSVSESFGGQAQYLASTGPGTITVSAPPPPPLDCSGKGKAAAKCESLLADPTIVSNTQLTVVAMDDSPIQTTGACAPTAMLANGQFLAVSTSSTSGQPQNYVNNYKGSTSTKYQTLLTINLPSGMSAGTYAIRITACDSDGDSDQWTWDIAVAGDGAVTTATTTAGPVDCTAKGKGAAKCESLLADPAVASNTQLTIVAMDDSPIQTSGVFAPGALLGNGQALTVTTADTSGQPQNYVDNYNGSASAKYQTLITITLPAGLAAGNYSILVTAYDGDGDLDQWSWPITVASNGTVTSDATGGTGGPPPPPKKK